MQRMLAEHGNLQEDVAEENNIGWEAIGISLIIIVKCQSLPRQKSDNK